MTVLTNYQTWRGGVGCGNPLYNWLVWVLVTSWDLPLVSEWSLVALSPKVMGSDGNSRKIVTELNWIVEYQLVLKSWRNCIGKNTTCVVLVRLWVKKWFRATYPHQLGFIPKTNHLNTVTFLELWFFPNISLYHSLGCEGHTFFQRNSTMWSRHIPFSSMSQV